MTNVVDGGPMPSWLLDTLRSAISPTLVANAARHLDERPVAVQDGLTAAVTTIVAALALRADDADTVRRVVALFPGPAIDERVVAALGMRELGDPASAPAHDAGESLLAFLFAGRRDAIAASVARHAKLRTESAWAILDVSAPLVLAGLGARMHAGTSTVGLSAMLQAGHRELVERAASDVTPLLAANHDTPSSEPGRRKAMSRIAWRLTRRWRHRTRERSGDPDTITGAASVR
jgi:hypothetical protein